MTTKEIKATIKDIQNMLLTCKDIGHRERLKGLLKGYKKLLSQEKKLQMILREGE